MKLNIHILTLKEILASLNSPNPNLKNPENYIQLPVQDGILYIEKYRLSLDDEVKTAGDKLELNLQNTAVEKNGREYIGNINWYQAVMLNLLLGAGTLPPRKMIDFLLHLKNKKNVLDGNNKIIQPKECLEIFNEITEVREPYRAEWNDADFKYINGKRYMNTNHALNLTDKTLTPKDIFELENHVREDCYVDLTAFNEQGFPMQKSAKQEYNHGKNIFYYFPRDDNNSVARFRAVSDWSGLYCVEAPSNSIAGLGVRRVFFHKKSGLEK